MEDKEIFDCWELFKTLLRKTKREGVEELIKWLDNSDFKFAPASTKYHNSFRGGLLKHSLDTYFCMYDFKNFIDYFSIPEDSIILTSLLHDICKVGCYKQNLRNVKNEDGQWVQVPYYEWEDLEPLGHGEKSVMLMYEYGVKPTKIERAMIRNHMGYSLGDDNKRDVSALFAFCPQTLLLHWADEEATFVIENIDLLDKYKTIMYGRNLAESNLTRENLTSTNQITVNGKTYKIADEVDIIDGKNIINLKLGHTTINVVELV